MLDRIASLNLRKLLVRYVKVWVFWLEPRWLPVSESLSNDKILYSESPGRFVVTVAPENKERFESAMEGLCYSLVGMVTEDKKVNITDRDGSSIIDLDIVKLKKSWKERFGGLV